MRASVLAFLLPWLCEDATSQIGSRDVAMSVINFGTPYGPDIHGIVENSGAAAERVRLSTGLTGPCAVAPRTPMWVDSRLNRPVEVTLDPGAWFAAANLTGLNSYPGIKACKAEFIVEVWSGSKWAEAWRRAHPLAGSVRTQAGSKDPGTYQVRMNVAEDNYRSSGSDEGRQGRSIQIQVRVENRTEAWRDIALTGRALKCAGESSYDWTLGPGEAPNGLAAGPIQLAPKQWVVFSQRLMGTGNPADCNAEIRLSELIGGTPLSKGRWQVTASNSIRLKPSVDAKYVGL